MSFNFVGPVDALLKKDNLTLHDLLNEDEVVSEAHKKKPELITVLTTKENFKQLVSYVVDLQPATAPEAQRMRYPVVASEILMCDDEKISKALLSSETLARFFNFFANPKPDLLLSAVVIKVLISLLELHTAEVFKQIKEHEDWVNNILAHLECSVVSDFLVKLSNGTKEVSTQEWLLNFGLVEKIYQLFSKEKESLHVNAYNTIMELLADPAITWTNPLVQKFASEKCLSILSKELFAEGNTSGFIQGTKVLSKLLLILTNWIKEPEQEDDEEDETPKTAKLPKPDSKAALTKLPAIVQEVTKHLSKFSTWLSKPPGTKKIQDQSGRSIEAFGSFRVQVLEVVSAVLEPGFTSVVGAVVETDFLEKLWEAMFLFDTNPFCHRYVERITNFCLEVSAGETQSKVLKKTKLIEKIIAAETAATTEKHKALNIPYLHGVGRMVQHVATTNAAVKPTIEGTTGWVDYSTALDVEKKKLDELCSAKNIGADDESNIFKPGQHYGEIEAESEAYNEGHDGDAEDLSLDDNIDMDSANDFDDYDIDHAEVLLRKEEIEAFS